MVSSSLAFDYVDEGILGSTWDSDTLTHIGFGFPKQYEVLKELENSTGLSNELRFWLSAPKTFGTRLEWPVLSYIENRRLERLVLCMNNQPSGITESHDIFWKDFDLNKDVDKIMEIYPDVYGVDKIKFRKSGPTVEVVVYQIKLGGSGMSKGGDLETLRNQRKNKAQTKGQKSKKSAEKEKKEKPDTVVHMILQMEFGLQALEAEFPWKVQTSKKVYCTRKLSEPCLNIIRKEGIELFDTNTMWDLVWPESVRQYALATNIEWIKKK